MEDIEYLRRAYGLPYITAKEELEEYNIMPEYNALTEFLKLDLQPKDRLYKQARHNILKYIIISVENDPKHGSYYSEETQQLITQAGQMLYEEGGMRSMHDPLVWSFIPKRYGRDIDCAWDGIGEWKA